MKQPGDHPLTTSKRGAERIRAGHPWVFRDDLAASPDAGRGTIVPLLDPRGNFLGQGFCNPGSRIAFRLITRKREPVDRAFWETRLARAIRYRESLSIDSNARRLVSSEADGFPGLIVDDYNGFLSVQVLSLGMERLRALILDLLHGALSPRAVIMRNDSPVRALEGLDPEKGTAAGQLPGRVEVQEGDIRYEVDLLNGQKTGAFLDQRDNRLFLRSLAPGRRVLDAFCYEGGFALHLARAGASSVTALDSSEPALEQAARNAALNGITQVETQKANCFDALGEMARGEARFDLIVLDPPPFARRKADVPGALRAYREINLRGIQCLAPGGYLFTCCCSHGVSQDLFAGAVAAAAGRARRRIWLLEQRLQSPDHPILFNEPESLYLKGMLFRCL